MSTTKAEAAEAAHVAGPLLIRYLLNWGLQGVLCAQVYSYYVAFPNDRNFFKLLVYGVFLIETLETGLATSDAFAIFASGFMNTAPIKAHLAWLEVPVNSGIVGCIGQLFFASRIKMLSRSWMITSCIVFLAFLTSASALAAGGQFFHISKLNTMTRPLTITMELWLSSNTACSIMIASVMTYYLLQQDNEFCPRSQTVLSKVICLFVETGTLSAAVAVIDLALYIGSKGTFYYTVPALFTTKVYSNTLLVVFNNRMSIIGGRQDMDMNDPLNMAVARVGSRWRRRKGFQDGHRRVVPMDSIHVRTEVWTDTISLDRLELVYSTNKALHEAHEMVNRSEVTQVRSNNNDDHVGS